MNTQPEPARMTADEFLVWAEMQPDRYELVNGEVFLMAAGRAAHVVAKGAMFRALADAVEAGNLPCQAMVDGMAVRIDEATIYEPDVLVRCGKSVPEDALEISDPVVVVEVLSPSSKGLDSNAKLDDYFRLQSVRHYLVVNTVTRLVIHYRRKEDGTITLDRVREGRLGLDPPGMEIDVERVFATR